MMRPTTLLLVGVALVVGMAVGEPTSSAVPTNTGDQAAQHKLINAWTEAALAVYYFVGDTWTGLTKQELESYAPEFNWTPGRCVKEGTVCMSFRVVSIRTHGDGQGLLLADHSTTGTCWYSLTVAVHPPRNPGPGLLHYSGTLAKVEGGEPQPGHTGFAMLTDATSCQASTGLADWTWFPSFAAITGNG